MHRTYLLSALEAARKRLGFCAPNPSVGAMLVTNGPQGQQESLGWHEGPGTAHAEVMALNNHLATDFSESILYVTLEPCCIYGRTPPCTEFIIKNRIQTVVFAYVDPNPKVSGQGQQQLLAAGLQVLHYPLPEIDDFYRAYTHWVHHGLPYVQLKLALSLDGKIAKETGKPAWLTGEAIGRWTHQQRYFADALLTSANTVNLDDPQLNVRLNAQTHVKTLYILDSLLSLSQVSQVYRKNQKLVLFHSDKASSATKQFWQDRCVECRLVSGDPGELDLSEVLTQIGVDGVQQLWVESGAQLSQALLRKKLVNEAFFYVAPKILGTNALASLFEPKSLEDAQCLGWKIFGQDALLAFRWQ